MRDSRGSVALFDSCGGTCSKIFVFKLSLLELLFIREGAFSCSLLSSETDHLDFICTARVVDINNDTSTILICSSLIPNFVIFIDIICYVCHSSSLSVHV